MQDVAFPPAPAEFPGQVSHESPSQYLPEVQFAVHVVALPPALIEPSGQFVHAPSLMYWFLSHDFSRQTLFLSSFAPGTSEPVLKVFAPQFAHSLFLAYLFASHVHVVAEPPALVDPDGHASQ